jgi:2-(1,2-epoxy-1,2-dihydrophenyl)acetyl-CoA isomerase
MGEFVLLDRSSSSASIRLNRPDVLNSFNRAMAAELKDALVTLRDDRSVRSILLTGEGRAFCAGQDLSEVLPVPGETPQLGAIVESSYNPIVSLLRAIEKPIVCAVNGVAAGAGANLAFACDIVYASEKASFIQSFSKVGLVPDTGGTYFLPRLVGPLKAAQLMMLGERVTADEAFGLGLVAKVCTADELLREAIALADRLAGLPTYGLGLTKRALNASLDNSLDQQLKLEANLQQAAGESHDYAEGVDAFVNKREPVYLGK